MACRSLASILVVFAACSKPPTTPERVATVANVHTRYRGPIIDVHLHTPLFVSGTPTDPDNAPLRAKLMAGLREHRVEAAMLSGTYDFMDAYRDEPGIRLLSGVVFPCPDGKMPNGVLRCFPDGAVFPSIEYLRSLHAAGRLAFLGEITAQYMGMAPDDPALEPYWSLAEELDIPVAIHVGFSKPGIAYSNCGGPGKSPPRCSPDYRVRLSDPLLLEPVLLRHPKLRVLVAHAGWPLTDHMVALMWMHPQVHVDTFFAPPHKVPNEYYRHLQRLVDAGFGKRILFGSDTMMANPEAIGRGVEAIQHAPFLTLEQKRDILHDNAARFLRLPASEPAVEQ